jgi:hypothetical protein
VSSIPALQRRGVDDKLGGQNRGGRQNREEDGGNGALTLTKSSSVRITRKPDKVGSASGIETRFMSFRHFLPNSITRI